MVISSRISKRFLEQLPFLGVTLLPFTNEQRDKFIDRWFGPDRGSQAAAVRQHCQDIQAVGEVARTPLAATILCVLAGRGWPLPRTEVDLYRLRFELLVSDYDSHKGINRVTSERSVLEKVARKAAFGFHSAKAREASRDDIVRMIVRSTNGQLSVAACATAVNELVEPCNILVPMTDDGLLGFGHLRYQEYLVALELLSNRAVDVVERMRNQWWHGALRLLAEMSDSLVWLVDRLVEQFAVRGLYPIAEEMIQRGPVSERETSLQMLQKFARADERDEVIFDPLMDPNEELPDLG